MLLFNLYRGCAAVHEVCHYVCKKDRLAGGSQEPPGDVSPIEKRLGQILHSGGRMSPLRSLRADCCRECRLSSRNSAGEAGVSGGHAPWDGGASETEPARATNDGNGSDRAAAIAMPRHGECPAPYRAVAHFSWAPPPGWLANAIFVLCLTLFPFATIGSRMAANAAASAETAREMLGCASLMFLNKLIISAAIACGWVFVFNPLGMAASAVDTFLNEHEILASTSLPHVLQPSYTLRPMLAAFFGWYLHFTAYSFYRARRDDVRSARFLGVLFRKLLLALALGSILSIDSHSVSTSAAAFLIGFLPASALATLKDYGAKIGGGIRASGGGLAELSALSTWELVRLEEEGIDSLASLLMTPKQYLRGCLPMSAEVVDLWYDQAALIVVVGAERYARLCNVCQTASYFVANSADPGFQAKVKAAAEIDNTTEIAMVLREKFGEATPAQLKLAAQTTP